MKRVGSFGTSIAFILAFIFSINSFLSAQQIWQQTASEIDYPIYKFTSLEDNLYAAFYGAGVFKTTDEGENWTACHNGLADFLARDIAVLNNTLFVGTSRGGIFKSSDIGQSWQAVNNEILPKDTWSLLATKNRLFAGTAKGLFYTDDEGENWQKASLPQPKTYHQIIFSLGVKGGSIIAGSNSYIYLSEDFGETWEQIKVPTSLDIMAVQAQNNTWLLGTSGEGILSSENGRDWNLWNKESGNTRSLILVEDNLVLGSAIQGVVGLGIDQNVTNFNEGFSNVAIRSLGYHDGKMYAGTYKHGIWRYDIPKAEFTPPNTSRKVYRTVNIYPNPTSEGAI